MSEQATPGRRRAPATAPIPREDPTPPLVGQSEAYGPPGAVHAVDLVPGRRTIKVTWGEENYHPVAYNGFKVGGVELVIDVPPSQTIEEAYDHAWERLDAIVRKQFDQKLEGFIQRLRTAGQAVKVSAASKG